MLFYSKREAAQSINSRGAIILTRVFVENIYDEGFVFLEINFSPKGGFFVISFSNLYKGSQQLWQELYMINMLEQKQCPTFIPKVKMVMTILKINASASCQRAL